MKRNTNPRRSWRGRRDAKRHTNLVRRYWPRCGRSILRTLMRSGYFIVIYKDTAPC